MTRWLHLGTSLVLGTWIIWQVDWAEFSRTVSQTDGVYLSMSLAISPLLALVSSWKWQILLRARDSDPGVAACFKLYLVGYFFNNFLPTNVGGDVVRGHLMGKRVAQPALGMASVFLERFTGLTALVFLASAALLTRPGALWSPHLGWLVGGIASAYAVLLWGLLDRRVSGFMRSKSTIAPFRKLVQLQEAIDAYRDHPSTLLACVGLSVLFYLGAGLNVFVSARAFQGDLSISEALIATPLILAIIMLPISFGGLGLSEWAHITVLSGYGISPAIGLSTALLLRCKNILFGILGSVTYALFREQDLSPGRMSRGAEVPIPASSGTTPVA